MNDIETTVYDAVAAAYDAKYPKGSRYSEPVETPVNFPCFTLWQANKTTYENSTDGDGEHHQNLLFQLDVYSNKTSGAKQECKAITDLIDRVMLGFGFSRTYSQPTRNQDTQISRHTTRYVGVLGEDNIIYRR